MTGLAVQVAAHGYNAAHDIKRIKRQWWERRLKGWTETAWEAGRQNTWVAGHNAGQASPHATSKSGAQPTSRKFAATHSPAMLGTPQQYPPPLPLHLCIGVFSAQVPDDHLTIV